MSIGRTAHALDARLLQAGLFAWFKPALEVAIRQWPVVLAAGIAQVVVRELVARLPWPYFQSWWQLTLHVFVETLVLSLTFVAGYRWLAERESAGTVLEVNPWLRTLICAAQVAVTWAAAGLLVALALNVLGGVLAAVVPSIQSLGVFVIVFIFYAVYTLAIVMLILSPLWAVLAVANALSMAHAVRSLDSGFHAVLSSLSIARAEKWRVFWPSYVVGLAIVGPYLLQRYIPLKFFESIWTDYGRYFSVVLYGFGVALAFVIERACSPELGNSGIVDAADDVPRDPSPASAAPGPHAGTTTGVVASAAASPTQDKAAIAADAAEQLEQELRANRTQRLSALVEQGLAADPRFFALHPDSTVVLAKKIAQARPDLAARLLQPYLKDHRGHRFHLTGALLVANILIRDPRRAADAPRFLAQVKTLYPNEPMVDQLIKAASKTTPAEQRPTPAEPR